MSESASEASDAEGVRAAGGGGQRKGKDGEQSRGLFARIALFFRQVISELKKVVTPTRTELIQFTSTVLVFVGVVMAFVALVDFIVGKGVLALFGN